MEYKIKELNVSDIKPDKNQPRKTFDEEQLQHLAESILSNGLLNPIEVDEDYIITDGERRWRASKLAKLKTIPVRVVKNKDKTEKLRRQLIFTLQDEEIPSEEKYDAIVKLFKCVVPTQSQREFARMLGISEQLVRQAFQYCKFAIEEPEIAKKVSPHIIIETASLPEKERKEVLKEFEGTKDKKKDLIRELVNVKKKEVADKKIIQELSETNKKLAEAKKLEIKVETTEEVCKKIRNEIFRTQDQLNNFMASVQRIRKTKFYFYKVREKESFIKVLSGASERARKWADQLDDLKDNLELELIKE